MSFAYDYNNSAITGAQAMYQLKTLLKTQGWVINKSSDGTTYNSSGDQITSGSSGATGMANNSAWFVIMGPTQDGYNRSFAIQRGTTNLVWKVKYSLGAGFSGGSPSATQMPSATDEQTILGGGTDASPSFASLFAADSGYRYHAIAGGAAENYVFYSAAYPIGGGTCTHSIYFDRLASSTYATEDSDPYVMNFGANALTSAIWSNSANNCPLTWWKKGLVGETFTKVMAAFYYDGTSSLIGATGTNPFNGKDDGLPIFYGRPTAAGTVNGFKGISRFLYFKLAARSTGDTISVSSTRDKIYFDDIIFPWNGVSPLI